MKMIPAVSAVLVCGNKVFSIVRQPFLRAFPGYTAFPGGKVDKEDYAGEVKEFLGQLPLHFAVALMRELQEELELDLDSENRHGNLIQVKELGNAVTPDFNPYRFDTHFYLIEFKKKPNFVVDKNEVEHFAWQTADELIKKYDRGEMLVVPPIINLLRIMKDDLFNEQDREFQFDYDKDQNVPCIESINGVVQLLVQSHTLPPATRTNAFLIGDLDENRILIDPAPKSDDEYQKMLNTLESKPKFSAIFLTHQHGDHIERANILAKHLNVPIYLSEITKSNIVEKHSEKWFEGIKTKIVREGDIVTTWLGHLVKVMNVPGHDAGQLGLYPENKNWFLVGDLIQGIGTVVIAEEEGNMADYFNTLKRIIGMQVKAIIPSHGIILGSVNQLEKTLKHRTLRESQVLEYTKQGKSVDEILPLIYQGIDQRLLPLAKQNINSHLVKLKSEKKLV